MKVKQIWDGFFRNSPRPTEDFMQERAPQDQLARESF
jgi:hypothetical protein